MSHSPWGRKESDTTEETYHTQQGEIRFVSYEPCLVPGNAQSSGTVIILNDWVTGLWILFLLIRKSNTFWNDFIL